MPIVITNRRLADIDFFERIEFLCDRKPRAIILREKDLSEEEYFELAKKVKKICDKKEVKLVVNSFIEVASLLEIKNVHLPFPMLENLIFEGKGDVLKNFKTVGTSIHSAKEAEQGERLGADYVIAGHIFKTACKENLEPRGLEFLKEVCERVQIPVYAIGGINNENTRLALESGATDVCVMSSAMTGKYKL